MMQEKFFFSGSIYFYQRLDPDVVEEKPTHFIGLPPVKQVAALGNAAFFLTKDGSVWAWGDISPLVINLPFTPVGYTTPVMINNLKSIEKMIIHEDKIYFINNEGLVWKGITLFNHKLNSVSVPGLCDIVDIQGSAYKIFFINTKGEVWAKGYNAQGQLGVGLNESPIGIPTQVKRLHGICKIICWCDTTQFFDGAGNIWNCGIIGPFKGYLDVNIQRSPIMLELKHALELTSLEVRPHEDQCCVFDQRGNLLTYYIHRANVLYFNSNEINLNIRSSYFAEILGQYSMSFNEAMSLACSKDPKNLCFYDLVIGILRTKPITERMYYILLHLSESPFYRESEAIDILFKQSAPLATYATINTKPADDAQYQIISALTKIWEYFNIKYDNFNYNKDNINLRFDDICSIFNIILFSGVEEKLALLKEHMDNTESLFTYYHYSLFGFSFSSLYELSNYNQARDSLMKALHLDNDCLHDGKNLLQIFSSVLFKYFHLFMKPDERHRKIHENIKSRLAYNIPKLK